MVHGFFAYPSSPQIAEVIRNGVSKINETGLVHLRTWESCNVGGKLVITEICNAIDDAPLFCADLTSLNHNVMFELGFAIARNKRIWPIIDPSVVETKADFAKLKLLTTVGYSSYCNSNDLQAQFLTDKPWTELNSTVFETAIKPSLSTTNVETILYLKSRHITESSTSLSKELANASKAMRLPLITDDPRETAIAPLAWYGEQSYVARCVVVHLINQSREGAHLHNAKCSFVGGLAYGFGKPILMLAQGDYLAPLDYRDLLRNYQTSTEAERHLHSWILALTQQKKVETQAQQLYLTSVKLAQQLAQLKIGEPVAENEADRLVRDYFVETTAYREALDGRRAIFVGRKGAGKSANLLKLASALGSDRRNLVCVIKPLSYEMRGIVELLSSYKSLSLKSYTIESLWKFLIYSEIALAAEGIIRDRPSGQIYEHEKDLIAILDQNTEMLRSEFSVRLERCIQSLLQSSHHREETEQIEQGRLAVSEALHSGLLRKLREVLVTALRDKSRVAILVDNLDKAWDKQSDIENLSEFLLGLLGATDRVAADFRSVGRDHLTLNTSLAVFVRSDIFYQVMAIAREPDKIVSTKVVWNDDEILLRVVDERFADSLGIPPDEVWAKYFCATVRAVPTKQYLLSRILKRPRDLLVYVKASITMAVNRRHGMVQENDILDAEKQYSQFAIDSILVENGITFRQLEDIIYEFVGAKSVVRETDIHKALDSAHVDSGALLSVIQHLCSLTFFGVEVSRGEFRFAEDQSESQKNSVLAQRLVVSNPGERRYQINPAFWAFLETSHAGL